MKRHNVLLLLVPVLFAALIALTGFLLNHQQNDFERVYLSESRAEIEQNVQLILDFILPRLEIQDLDLLDEFCDAYAQGNRSVTFFNERGNAVITSGNVNLQAFQQDLPEIHEARTHKTTGIAVRKNPRNGIWTVFAAAEVELPNRRLLLYVTAPAQPVSNVLNASDSVIYGILFGGLILLGGLSAYILLTIYRPLNLLQKSVEQIASGRIETPVAIPPRGAVRELAVSVSGMAEQLRHEIQRVQEQETLRLQFLSNVSHEIKTPLTGILSALQILEESEEREDVEQNAQRNVERTRTEDELRKWTKCRGILTRQTARLNALVQDFLQLTRLENPPQTPEDSFQSVSLASIVSGAVELCEDFARQNSVQIHVTELTPVEIRGDAKLLEQAIQNLILNAVKYSGSLEVNVSLELRENQPVVTVRDFGTGIPPEYAERIFDRFFRIRSSAHSQEEGSGLGLAIVRHIMRLHGGTVKLVPCDEGACFECWFKSLDSEDCGGKNGLIS